MGRFHENENKKNRLAKKLIVFYEIDSGIDACL